MIENFNDSVVFNSCIKSGFNNTYNSNAFDRIHQLYDNLLKEKDEQIKTLKDMIELLNKK